MVSKWKSQYHFGLANAPIWTSKLQAPGLASLMEKFHLKINLCAVRFSLQIRHIKSIDLFWSKSGSKKHFQLFSLLYCLNRHQICHVLCSCSTKHSVATRRAAATAAAVAVHSDTNLSANLLARSLEQNIYHWFFETHHIKKDLKSECSTVLENSFVREWKFCMVTLLIWFLNSQRNFRSLFSTHDGE